jgi:hypothetical protein
VHSDVKLAFMTLKSLCIYLQSVNHLNVQVVFSDMQMQHKSTHNQTGQRTKQSAHT